MAQMAVWDYPLSEGFFNQIPTFSPEEAATAAEQVSKKARHHPPKPGEVRRSAAGGGTALEAGDGFNGTPPWSP